MYLKTRTFVSSDFLLIVALFVCGLHPGILARAMTLFELAQTPASRKQLDESLSSSIERIDQLHTLANCCHSLL